MSGHYSKTQAFLAVTNSPWTRDHRHVTAIIPRAWTRRMIWKDPRINDVKPKDRIKWWNVVPGDQVRVLGDKEGSIREVFRINKLSNRVYLKRQGTEDTQKMTGRSTSQQVHYSRCQLFVGRHKFPPAEGSTEPTILPVFATRVSTSPPEWRPDLHRWDWDRYAVNTAPRLPGWTKEANEKVFIPWPKTSRSDPPKPTAYDTTLEAVTEVTYKPPSLPLDPKAFIPRIASQHEYIKSLSTRSAFDPAAPVEVYLQNELSSPFARAKKQARWQAYEHYKQGLLDQYIKAEVNNLDGRIVRDAKAEAVWKWRNRMIEERKAEIKKRWKDRGQETKMTRKRERQAKQKDRIHRKMRELVLTDAPNQIVPGSG
ncbi:hypothetical protein PHLCEN_2v10509 [Hermanssonia centrifuga]|uniref:Uncharacterized protein n=1 Tax=Hermanssonia centrifuga TaxID=98765 RepID=A0A2R6NML5_9APHY|nr:hypothetical protein PHLCEN_2v10509 [Hermanssonia centrifuga]